MNAHPKFIATSAHVDEAAIQPLPRSRKVYAEGSRADLLVPMRDPPALAQAHFLLNTLARVLERCQRGHF